MGPCARSARPGARVTTAMVGRYGVSRPIGPEPLEQLKRQRSRTVQVLLWLLLVVMVGALLVSGVETVWSGEEIPAYGKRITRKDYRGQGIVLERFAEMARFNYGSTVIVLLPAGVAELSDELAAETPVRLGQRLALRVRGASGA